MFNLPIHFFYTNASSNGYGKDGAFKRFETLKKVKDFHSLLDVGSGPCFLQEWLIKNIKHPVDYEAMDIRKDTLNLCGCTTYLEIPSDKKYDICCMFGTVTFNIDNDKDKNKTIFNNLINSCCKITDKILLTTFKEDAKPKIHISKQDRFVYFSKQEITDILGSNNLKIILFEEPPHDPMEYHVVCEKNNA